jgi:hypothetical protein
VSASLARRCVLLLGAASLVLLLAPKARADVLVSSASGCDEEQISQPFLPWLDSPHYFSIGDFENDASDWTLSGGAAVIGGNEPWDVSDAGDSHSLDLPPGSTATSPTVTMPVLASLLPVLPGDQTPIAFRFTVLGSADWQIDDTYVDPWRCC